MKKRVKIFLAAGEGLREESLELADLVEHLNLILEPLDIQIYLTKWDYLADASLPSSGSDSSSDSHPSSGGSYDDILEDCEICMVVFGKEFGSFTEKELRKAYERVCREGVNPDKLYVYFKGVEGLSQDLRRFRDSFPEAYGHFTGSFSDINTLKNDFLLQFQLFQSRHLNNACPVEVNNAKVTLFGKDLFIDLMKVPFLGNNEDYRDLLKNIKTIEKLLAVSDPEDEDYAEYANQLKEFKEKRDRMEKSIWSTAVDIARLSNQKCSERLRKAIERFNAGDNKGASAILDTEDIINDAKHNPGMKRFPEEGLKTNIEELRLKIRTLENEKVGGWRDNVLKLQEKVIEYTVEVFGKNSEEYIKALLEAGSLHSLLGQFNQALILNKEALSVSRSLFSDDNETTATCLNNLGVSYGELGDHHKALEYIGKAYEISKETGRTESMAAHLNRLGRVYALMGDAETAKAKFEEAISLLPEDHPEAIDSKERLSTMNYVN